MSRRRRRFRRHTCPPCPPCPPAELPFAVATSDTERARYPEPELEEHILPGPTAEERSTERLRAFWDEQERVNEAAVRWWQHRHGFGFQRPPLDDGGRDIPEDGRA